ncbi:MAG: DNA polymerase III subunit epsilon, partial [Pseudomonadales bacterium]|nr:DNA polymerase III subunit epsilon [Pseudomonadales bacterium]
PGQKNSLDALCRRYGIDNSERDLHGALLDAELLADVFLAMTGGQTALSLGDEGDSSATGGESAMRRLPADRKRLMVVSASAEEEAAHRAWLDAQDGEREGGTLWRSLGLEPS